MDELDHRMSKAPHAVAIGRRRAVATAARTDGWWKAALLVPAIMALGAFFVVPVGDILWTTFTEPTPGFESLSRVLSDPVIKTVLVRTLVVALATATITLILAYPYAYLITLCRRRMRAVLFALVLLPFWTSLMARTFAWIVILQPDGPLVKVTSWFGYEKALLHSAAGVTIGMVQILLPFMVLPLYSCMSGIDRRLLSAASGLGARPLSCFRRIYLPLSMPRVVAGYSLVFILALGFYVTPALLGSPKESMIAQVIATRVEDLLDFAGAGALSLLLLAVTGLLLLAVSRVGFASAVLGDGGKHG